MAYKRLMGRKNTASKFKKRSTMRKRSYKRSSGVRIAPGPYNPTWRMVRNVVKLSGEKKFRDYYWQSLAIKNQVHTLESLNWVPVGTGPRDRIGQDITCKRLNLKGVVRIPNYTNADCVMPPPNYGLKLLLVLDKSNNGTLATFEDVKHLTVMDTGTPVMDAYALTYNNKENSDRFVILKDKDIFLEHKTLCVTADITTPTMFSLGTMKTFKMSVDLKGIVTKFIATNSVAVSCSDVKANNILMFLVPFTLGQKDSYADANLRFTMKTRFEFTDK